MRPSVRAVSMARSEYWSCPLRLPMPGAAQAVIASGVSQRVTSPRRTSVRSYAGQFPTRYLVLYFGWTLDFTSRSCGLDQHYGQNNAGLSPNDGFRAPTPVVEAEGGVRRNGPEPVARHDVASETARAVSRGVSCPGCGTLLTPSRPNQRHCSDRCRAEASRRRKEDRLPEWLRRALPDDPGRAE